MQRYQPTHAINNQLDNSFYRRDDVVFLARELLGKSLVTCIDGEITSGIISETEAYHQDEKACHAYGGKFTKRTTTLFEEGGIAYVYLCYGMHHLFNIVTGPKGSAQAVLVRGVLPHRGVDIMLKRRKMRTMRPNLSAGPGTLSQALGIKTAHNAADLMDGEIFIETNHLCVDSKDIAISARIGVGYAEEDAFLPWRFNLDPTILKEQLRN